MITPRLAAVGVLVLVAAGCSPTSSPSPAPAAAGSAPVIAAATVAPAPTGDRTLVLVGKIITMSDPPVAEAILIEDGGVAAVGTRDVVLARAGDQVPVVELGENVAYPGFIDAHSHWIGDRDYYGIGTATEAIDAAATRGWTSISEQWVNRERLNELTGLAAADALPLRVDAYLALNYEKEFLGDWYAGREPGIVDDQLRVQGVKIHLDHGLGGAINWEPADLAEAIRRADDAGWQVSVHSARTEAMELVLDAFEAALGPRGQPAPPPHRARDPGERRAAGPHGRDGYRDDHPPRRRRRLGAGRRVPSRVRPRRTRSRAGLDCALEGLRRRGAARRLGDGRAVDLPGLP